MPKHTIELTEKEIRVINVIKAVTDTKSIDRAVSFIIEDYAKNNFYTQFIENRRKKWKKQR